MKDCSVVQLSDMAGGAVVVSADAFDSRVEIATDDVGLVDGGAGAWVATEVPG